MSCTIGNCGGLWSIFRKGDKLLRGAKEDDRGHDGHCKVSIVLKDMNARQSARSPSGIGKPLTLRIW